MCSLPAPSLSFAVPFCTLIVHIVLISVLPCFNLSLPWSRTILLSVISLLNEPNTFSPANVDASVMYRKWRDSKGKDREYIEIIR